MIKIFCIPGAGASAVLFMPWIKEQCNSDFFRVNLLEIPGRGVRKRDTPAEDIGELADILIKKLEIQLEPNDVYILYGYCYGGIIGYEMCRRMKEKGIPYPERVFITSIGSPSNKKISHHVLENKEFRDEVSKMFVRYFPPQFFNDNNLLQMTTEIFTRKVFEKYDTSGRLQEVTLEELVSSNETNLMEEENIETILNFANESLKLFQYDQDMLLDYIENSDSKFKLPCPLTVIRGKEDTLTKVEDLSEWREYCDSEFNLEEVIGNHFTFEESRDEIFEIIKREVVCPDGGIILNI